jgi:hypothetical protein
MYERVEKRRHDMTGLYAKLWWAYFLIELSEGTSTSIQWRVPPEVAINECATMVPMTSQPAQADADIARIEKVLTHNSFAFRVHTDLSPRQAQYLVALLGVAHSAFPIIAEPGADVAFTALRYRWEPLDILGFFVPPGTTLAWPDTCPTAMEIKQLILRITELRGEFDDCVQGSVFASELFSTRLLLDRMPGRPVGPGFLDATLAQRETAFPMPKSITCVILWAGNFTCRAQHMEDYRCLQTMPSPLSLATLGLASGMIGGGCDGVQEPQPQRGRARHRGRCSERGESAARRRSS